MSNKNIFEDLLKETGNEYASIVEHGVEAGDVTGYVNTGSLALNALISGSIYGGIPDSKVTAFAGVSGVGKSYFSLNVVREFLKTYRDGFVYYFESESAISKDMFASRGIDIKRTAILPVSTIQEFRTQALKILNRYLEMGEDRPRILLVLDSLGNLSSEKELQDISDGKDTRDMTKAQLIRAAFRVLTLKLGKAKVPLIVTAHTYAEIGAYIPTQKLGGGAGLEYASSTIIFLTRAKDKDDKTKEVTGSIITANLKKSRLTVVDKKVSTLLDFREGLDPYYGLLPIALKANIVKKVGNKYQFPDGVTAFESAILKSPENFYTPEILDSIDKECQNIFLYGKGDIEEEEEVHETEKKSKKKENA